MIQGFAGFKCESIDRGVETQKELYTEKTPIATDK